MVAVTLYSWLARGGADNSWLNEGRKEGMNKRTHIFPGFAKMQWSVLPKGI